MRRRQLVAVVLVALLVSSGIALAKARGQPEISAQLVDDKVTPGEDTTLEVRLQNAGDVAYASTSAEQTRVTTARDVQVTLESSGPVTVETGTQPAGNVPEGLSTAIGFDVSVADDAEPGEYDLDVTLEYRYTNVVGSGGQYDEKERTVTREVTVVVEEDARFRVVEASGTDLFGTSGPVELTLENVGSAPASDARVTVQSGSGQLTFGGAASAETFLGEWPAGERRTVTLEGQLADGADRRSYPLATTVDYEDPRGDDATSETLRAGVSPRVDTRFSLEDVRSTLVVGEEGTVSGTITNRGQSTVRNAVVTLSPDSQTVEVVESEYAVGDLDPGESTDVTFDVEVSEASDGGPRQFSFVVSYRDRSNERRQSDGIDARVDVGDQRDVFAVSVANATVQAGGGTELRLEVTNRADQPVTDVSAKLFANAPISATDDEAFIDRLAPGETKSVVFGVGAAGGALEKVYPVSVDFQYDEADGDTLLTDTYQIPVSVTQPSGGGGGPPILPILVVLVLLGGVGYYLYRRRQS